MDRTKPSYQDSSPSKSAVNFHGNYYYVIFFIPQAEGDGQQDFLVAEQLSCHISLCLAVNRLVGWPGYYISRQFNIELSLARHHSHMAPPVGRKSQGRRKIEMKLIEDETARTVTFSKRRVGLFKKANELSILCGVQIAVIIFSLSGRAYSFGHPDVESVMGRFWNRNPIPNLQADSAQGMANRAAMLRELKDQLDEQKKEFEAKKKRAKEIEEELKDSPYQITEEKLDAMDIEQLKGLKEKMEKLRKLVLLRASALSQVDAAGPSNLVNITEFAIASNSVAEPADPSNSVTESADPSNSVTESGEPLNSVAQSAEPSNSVAQSAEPPTLVMVPAVPGKVNLANVGRNELEASLIPADWLKL